MEKAFYCESCSNNAKQFTVLICDHIMCSECLGEQAEKSIEGVVAVKCSCGIKTCFNNQRDSMTFDKSSINNIRNSTQMTINDSLLKSSKKIKPNLMKTETVNFNDSFLRSNDRSKLTKKSKLLNNNSLRNSFHLHTIEDFSLTQNNQRFSKEINSEIKFLEIQFTKSIEEVNKNYDKIVKYISKSYEGLIRNIKYFFFEQIIEPESHDFMNLSKIIQKKFDKTVGKKLKVLNESFFSQISSYKIQDEKDTNLTVYVSKEKQRQKQNNFLSPNCKHNYEKQRLMNMIEELKEEKKASKKGLRKVNKLQKYRLY